MNVVMILSVINTINKNLSYSPIRSIYSSDERYNQTLKTIESAKKYIPGSYIVLLECSVLNQEMESVFKNSVNLYLNYSQDPGIRSAVDGIHKSYAEGLIILKFLESDEFKGLPVENLFKLSGRYYLTEAFKLSEYLNQYNCFRRFYYAGNSTERYFSVLYKIHKESLEEYKAMFKNNIAETWNVNMDMEGFLCAHLKNNIKVFEQLGFEGHIAVNGQFLQK